MLQVFIFLFSLFFACDGAAQDERYIRALFSGDLVRGAPPDEVKDYHFKAQGPLYQIDLNGDHRNESLVIEKKDGEDWLHIHDYNLKRIFSQRFRANAANSQIYRLRLVSLSPTKRVLVIHFYEGLNTYLQTRANARFYFLTIDNGDLQTIAVQRGPAYWEEFKTQRDFVHTRKYDLEFSDITGDGQLEVVVRTELISYFYQYLGEGKWLAN